MKTKGWILGLVLTGCNTAIDPALMAPTPPPDTDLCDAMCRHLADLKCTEGDPVYDSDLPGPPDVPNRTCTAFCTDMQNKGVAVNPRCVLNVTSCDQIEPYRQKDPTTCPASK